MIRSRSKHPEVVKANLKLLILMKSSG